MAWVENRTRFTLRVYWLRSRSVVVYAREPVFQGLLRFGVGITFFVRRGPDNAVVLVPAEITI